MIILDTNVLSEMVKPRPEPRVVEWAHSTTEEKWTTTITAGELLTGVALLPTGRRRQQLADAVGTMLNELIERNALLDYDIDAALHIGQIFATRSALGRPIHDADAMIAAICRAHDAPLATRNQKDFEGAGVELIDPWA